MAQQYEALNEEHMAFIARQHMFFVASAADGAKINLSPKGLGGFRVIGERQVCYLDLTGSGAETAAHLRADGRLTIMMCAFEGQALILRLYGRGRSLPRGSAEYAALLAKHFDNQEQPGARQIVVLDIEMVQTSCGYGVPKYAYEGQRDTLIRWAQSRGAEGVAAYRAENNVVSLDGLATGLATEDA